MEYKKNVLTGLPLLAGLALITEEERNLFDPKDIVPQNAIGKDKPTEILSYQLKLAICPHLNQDNRCSIYDKRPLACKAYPVTSTIGKCIADLKCPQISKYSVEELYALEFQEEIEEAMVKINQIVGSFIQKRGKKLNSWMFDIATKKWQIELRRAR